MRDGEVATGDEWSFTVVDTTKPTAIAQNISVPLINGNVTITAQQINNGSSDDYGIKSLTINKTTFDCRQIGEHEVTLTVTDNNNNVSTATATVTVVGIIPAPAITVSRSNNTFTNGEPNTIFLGYGAQQLTLTAEDASSAQSSFVWAPAVYLSSVNTTATVFTPTATGDYSYTVEATNEFGCKATSAPVALKVIDARCGNNMDKVLLCKDGKSKCVDVISVVDQMTHGYTLGACNTTARNRNGIMKEEQAVAFALTVSPNPATQQTVIQFSTTDQQTYSLDVYNLLGMKVATLDRGSNSGNHTVRYNISNLSPGLYLLKLSVDGKVTTQKLVVQ